METIAIYGRLFGEEHTSDIQVLFNELKSRNKTILVYRPFLKFLGARITLPENLVSFSHLDDYSGEIDCLFSIGGDGTILDSVTLVGNKGIPIFGINTGRLGFLSTVKIDEISEALKAIDNFQFYFEDRMMLDLNSNPNLFGKYNFGLNEVVVHKKDSSSMIAIHTYVNGEILNTYWADGLIISTPTGSTAYSMSCGGPIITPGSSNFVITPVAPHSLTSRPIVVSSTDIITLKIEGRGKYFLVSIDSRMETYDSSLELEIKLCKFSTKLLRLKNQTFLDSLSNKLNWGLDQRN